MLWASSCRAQLFTWGWNQRGTLGHPPETKTESSPGPVDALAGVRIVQVRPRRLRSSREIRVPVPLTRHASPYGLCWFQAAIGGWHCLAVDDKGRAYAWGKRARFLALPVTDSRLV